MVNQIQEFDPATLMIKRRQVDPIDLPEIGSNRALVPRQKRAEPTQFPGSPKTSL